MQKFITLSVKSLWQFWFGRVRAGKEAIAHRHYFDGGSREMRAQAVERTGAQCWAPAHNASLISRC